MKKGYVLLLKLVFLVFLLTTGIPKVLPNILYSNNFQQISEVKGTVSDASTGSPLLGVSIMLKGTSTGTITDQDGNFTIEISSPAAILEFSHVGYGTHSEPVGSRTIINIALEPETQEIDEVVAIGYSTIKKSDLTGAVSSIKQADIEKAVPVNIQTAIQGRASGVYVSQNSGAPGREPIVRIRGTGTINDHAPIYVIDGMIMDNNDLRNQANSINFLNPADIESIEVLKDASATAIYGSRGGHGVILITTRKGFDSSPTVNFNAQLGFAKAAPMKELLGREEFMNYNLEAYGNFHETTEPDTLPELADMLEQYEKGYDTDWVDEILKDGPALSQSYNLSIRGGTEDARYASSFGYYNEEGLLIEKSNYERYSFRINSDYDLGRFLRIGENLVITQNQTDGYTTDQISPLWVAMRTSPLSPVLKENPDLEDPNYEYNKYEGNNIYNPVSFIYNKNLQNQTLSLFGNLFAEATFFKDFTLRSSIGLNLASSFIDEFLPEYKLAPDYLAESQVINSVFRTKGWLWENTLIYSKLAGNHSITALIGYTSEHNKFDYTKASKFKIPNNSEELRTLDAAISSPQASGGFDVVNMVSMLGRLNYIFANRYLLTASIRRDGSSKFGPGNKWGTFPSVSVGWRISNEGFFEDFKPSTMPMLKLRAGWGQIGNSSMSERNTNAYVSQIASSPLMRALFDEKPYQGYFFTNVGIPNLSWETAEQVNFGLDLGMFRNALSLTADYFIKTTRDMLVNVFIPGYAGYGSGNEPWINAGSVENRGFEYLLSYKGNSGHLYYEISTNGTTYKNEVLSTNPDSTEIWYRGDTPSRALIGYPIGSFYGYVTNGIFQTQEEVDNYEANTGIVQEGAHPGGFRFKDVNRDSVIDAGDNTIIGNPHPKFTFGLTVKLGYRGFDILTVWQGVYGNDIWNAVLNKQGKLNGGGNVYRERYLDAWRGEGSTNSQPIVSIENSNSNYRDSDYFVEDGSYLRMKLIQLGYSLPTSVVRKLKIESCRIWIGGTDLLTFTKYSGHDPEVGVYSNPLASGFDQHGTYPKTRRITVGINVNF